MASASSVGHGCRTKQRRRVMTPEFGAASQLEKIEMLDHADVVAINKFGRKGGEDALRDVRKQLQLRRRRAAVVRARRRRKRGGEAGGGAAGRARPSRAPTPGDLAVDQGEIRARQADLDGARPRDAQRADDHDAVGDAIRKVVPPEFSDHGDLLRWLLRENLPGRFPYTAGVCDWRAATDDDEHYVYAIAL